MAEITQELKNKILYYGSITLMTLSILLAMLVPMPYDGVNPVAFMMDGKVNVAAIVLFELFMICIFGFSWQIKVLTKERTFKDVKEYLVQCLKYKNLENMYEVIPQITSLVGSAEVAKSKEEKSKLKLEAETLKVNFNENLKGAKSNISLEKLMKEVEDLKAENSKLTKELKPYKEIEEQEKKKVD